MQITEDQIKKISMNRGKPEIMSMIVNFINEHGNQYFLNTPMRVKHFLGQCAVESTLFTKLEESLYYTAERMVQVWPSRFPNVNAAAPYARNPQKLANHTYGGRMGNTGPDDGWKYRGSSIKQITGKENTANFTSWMRHIDPSCPDFVINPDALRSIEWAVWPAVWYWVEKKCYTYADRDDCKGLTRAINGGMTGYQDRFKMTALAGKILNLQTNPTVTSTPPKVPDLLLKEYQLKMNKLSKAYNVALLDVGVADGWNGPKTMAAASVIQKMANLFVDGKIGPNTRKAIDILMEKKGLS